ncbi:MAG: gamma-glutamyl-gamma-aminobutyrate hydrolase family protein [Geminicoccaceae bacterium]|nr:gamma-glutamyl-gamma-aminobutyrate hydrolase family protein [Geminicoccaceae bacterium]
MRAMGRAIDPPAGESGAPLASPEDECSSAPLVGVSACVKQGEHAPFHAVLDRYVEAVVRGSGAVPVIVPALGPLLDMDALLDRLDGLLLTGSPSNICPSHYGGEPRPDDPADPRRDATTLPLVRRALARGVPLFAICRGLQELNVALGGSLHPRLHEVPGRADHRSDKSLPYAERYAPRHVVRVLPGGRLSSLLGSTETIFVNSLHGQGIDRLAPGLRMEAVAEDGTIEAVSVEGAPGFALGVQWHPEWRVTEDPVSRCLFAAFGAAARARASARLRGCSRGPFFSRREPVPRL